MSELLDRKGTMCAIVDAQRFSEALKKINVIVRKSSVPALSGILVHFSGGQCTLTGTNMAAWITAEFPSHGDDFAFVFSRGKDVERACQYFEGDITLELRESDCPQRNGGIATLSCGSRTGEFETYLSEGYPALPELKDGVSFNVNAAALMERINRVAYATQKFRKDSRERTSCVEFVGDRVYALDGFRAAWDVDSTLNFPKPFLVQAEHLRLLKMLGNTQVDFHLSGHWLHASDGNTSFIFRVIEDEPYDLHCAIPRAYVEEFSVSPQKLLSELKYLSDAAPGTVPPYIYLQGNTFYKAVNGRKYSTAIDNITRQSDLVMGFNLNYLTDSIRQFAKEPQIKVKISGRNTPVIVEAEGRSDCALLLPVRHNQFAAA